MLWLAIIAITFVTALGDAKPPLQAPMGPGGELAQRDFQRRVAEYVALRNRLEGPRPRTLIGEVPPVLYLGRSALAEEIRRMRALARQGDLISPDMAAEFRRLIRVAIGEGQLPDVLRFAGDRASPAPPPQIDGDYPAGAARVITPPCLLRVFPPLPEEVEYRFLGRDLLLVDVKADVILDYLPDAIPRLT